MSFAKTLKFTTRGERFNPERTACITEGVNLSISCIIVTKATKDGTVGVVKHRPTNERSADEAVASGKTEEEHSTGFC